MGEAGPDAVNDSAEAPSRLARRLGTFDAVVIGLGSMIGAGVFAALAPAARAAGNGLLVGLALAALVAYCNATSSAQLAAIYPESGGTYVYGRKRLGPFWGFLAGWGFVVGKLASFAAGRVPAVSVAWRRAHISRPMFIETAHTFRAKGICASVSASFQRSESTCVTREFRLLSPRWKLTPTSAPALGTTAASLS